MREGSLGAPIRHKVDWQNPDFTDLEQLDAEMRRIFDICHGCRRCFNLCDSFPKLFDLVDESKTGELDSVDSLDFKPVVDACTLCDMCFLTKCPYVPPHEFNLDFPHLMLRYRYAEHQQKPPSFMETQLTKMDRNGKLGTPVAPLLNWATKNDNALTRPVIESIAGIDRRASVPKFSNKTLIQRSKNPIELNTKAPAYGQKVAIYTTCFGNYHNPDIGLATRHVLAQNGVETQFVYPGCCGMPKLEQGDIAGVAKQAERVAQELVHWVDKGYTIMALVPSCALMLKQEWPLLTDHPAVKKLAENSVDVAEYIVKIAKTYGLADGLKPLGENLTVHLSCHSRAQNMGQKAADMLRLIPEVGVKVIERCSGHGGSWGMMVDHFDIALKVGKPVAKAALTHNNTRVLSECPLAGEHILQGLEALDASVTQFTTDHPILVMAQAYNWTKDGD